MTDELRAALEPVKKFMEQFHERWRDDADIVANADEARTGLTVGDLRRLIAAAEVSGWRPIETAPRDGTRVLLSGPLPKGEVNPTAVIGGWSDDRYAKRPLPYWEWGWMGTKWARDNPPTHWQPLPTPPEGKSE